MTKKEIKTEAKRFIIDRTIGLNCLAIPIEDVELDDDFENHFDKRDMADAFEAGANLILSQLTEKDKKIEELHKELADYQFNYSTVEELEEQIEELKKRFKSEHEINAKTNNNLIKRIEELKEDITDLINYKANVNNVLIKELEAQIEKMKCCDNCKHRFACGSRGYVCDKSKMFDEE